MKETNPTINAFFQAVKSTQTIWALQDKSGEDWVVCDSVNFEDADTMPIWSSKEAAEKHCTEEWADYQAAGISVADFLEFWIEDLNEDSVMLGLDWESEGQCAELEIADFTLALAEIESLK